MRSPELGSVPCRANQQESPPHAVAGHLSPICPHQPQSNPMYLSPCDASTGQKGASVMPNFGMVKNGTLFILTYSDHTENNQRLKPLKPQNRNARPSAPGPPDCDSFQGASLGSWSFETSVQRAPHPDTLCHPCPMWRSMVVGVTLQFWDAGGNKY